MAKLLVTGVDTLIGANLALALSSNFECFALAEDPADCPAGCQLRPWNPAQPGALVSAAAEIEPDWIIYTGHASRSCWDPPASHELERDTPQTLARLAAECQSRRIALTYLSTDAVFVGPRLFHEEKCVPTAQTAQARHARDLEAALERTGALVVRTHAYGWSGGHRHPGYVERLVERLEHGAWGGEDGTCYATPILVTDLPPLLERAFELNLQGLYHITGAERTNAHRFAREVAAALAFEIARPAAGEIETPRSRAPMIETSLNTRQARRDLGFAMPLLREGLERLAQQQHNGWRDRLTGGARTTVKAA